MKICPSCNGSCEDNARFCLDCGHPFDTQPEGLDDPWLGRVVAGRFKILEKLGEGGMGEVFRAEQMPMGRHVALKILRQSLSDDPQQVERFKREAQAASQLSHPNTIIVHDFGQDTDGTLFLAMEMLEGAPLNDVLDEEGRLAPERIVRVLMQICGSVQEAHECGVVHRDLKPENIFLIRRGGASDFVKVLDFGIAKVTQTSTGGKLETITQAGAIFGTPQYMSPEQIKGEELDARSDVYALGVMLYQMVAGHLPFKANTVMEMLTKHLSTSPVPMESDIPAEEQPAAAKLEAIALRALSKDRTDRQSSALEMLEDLTHAFPHLALGGMTGMMPSVGASSTAPHTLAAPLSADPQIGHAAAPRRSGLVIGIAAIVVGGGVAAALLLNKPAPSTDAADAQVAAVAGDTGAVKLSAQQASTEADRAAQALKAADALHRAATAEEAQKIALEVAAKHAAETKAAEAAKAVALAAAAEDKVARTKAEAAAKTAEAEAARFKAELDQLREEREAASATKAEAQAQRDEALAQKAAAEEQGRRAEATLSKLRIMTPTAGAKIYIDGVFRGKTPLRVISLPPGKHRLEAVRGEKRTRKTVTLRAGRFVRVKLGV